MKMIENPTLKSTLEAETPLVTTVDTPLVLPFEIELFQQDEDVASIFGYTTLGGFDRNVFANNGLKMSVGAASAVTWYQETLNLEMQRYLSSLKMVLVVQGFGWGMVWLNKDTKRIVEIIFFNLTH